MSKFFFIKKWNKTNINHLQIDKGCKNMMCYVIYCVLSACYRQDK